MFSALEKFDIFVILPIFVTKSLDFSLTNLSLYMIFVVVIMLFLGYLAIFEGKLIPNFYQLINEYMLKFVFGIVDKQIGQMGMFMVHFYLYYLCSFC